MGIGTQELLFKLIELVPDLPIAPYQGLLEKVS